MARECVHQVAYLPGLSMRRIADLYPGQAETDARDAFISADSARTMPHTLRRVDTGDDTLTELGVLVGFDDDLAGEATRITNRIRGLLTGIHPALERVLGPRITHRAVLEILSRCGGPAGLRTAGTRRLTATAVVLMSLTIALSMSACSLTPTDFPSPRAGVETDYSVTIQFESALNLPIGADVMLNGIRVGEVESLTDGGNSIDAAVGLAIDSRIPYATKAIIRQNTLLGDTYVALTPPVGNRADTQYMRDGDVIGLEHSVSPPQLEDTIAVLAYFVNGGSIQKVQDSMVSLNNAMPPADEVRKLAATVSVDLADLAARTDEVDRTLNGLDSFAKSFDNRAPELQAVFSPEGAHYWNRIASAVVGHISTLLPSLGSIFAGGHWLVPMLESSPVLPRQAAEHGTARRWQPNVSTNSSAPPSYPSLRTPR